MILQPGDRLFIALPGEESLNKVFAIDSQGKIRLPEVGEFKVANQTVSVAQKRVKQKLSRIFRDLNRFKLFIQERRILITVLGYVKKPGAYDLPAQGNVQMALEEAGGLKPGAQLDRIQRRRLNHSLTFNYKRYLDTGDPSELPPLKSLDTVFVPASPLIGNVQIEFDAQTLVAGGDAGEDRSAIKVFGEVKNPGSFSFKPNYTIVDMLMRAGGVTRYAGVEQIRLINHDTPQTFDLKAYLDQGDPKLLPKISPGATIFVPKEVIEIKAGASTVYVMGEVFKPGAYEGKDGATFMDILANAGGPSRFAETRRIRILSSDGSVRPFDLTAYTEGDQKTQLPKIYPGDAIFVPEKIDFNAKSWLKVPPSRAIGVIGAVYRPGRYEWSDEMSLLDLLAHAGGPTARADIANLQILTKEENETAHVILFDLNQFLEKGGDLNRLPKLHAGYQIVIPELPQDPSDNKAQWIRQPAENSIYIMGAVSSPGRYMFNTSMDFLDILAAANGPRPSADLHNIRVTHRNRPHARVSPVDLALYFQKGDESLLPHVLPGDVIFVPERDRNWLDDMPGQTVRILGAINKPGRYRFHDEMSILDLLATAGGTTATAYLENIIIINRSTHKDRSHSFDLAAFVESPNFDQLPALRAGDTVFIPDQSKSYWNRFMLIMRDTVSIFSFALLISGAFAQ
ncbi:SLBB domain-containing protein [Magnetococcales bacterium HHB-1]